MKFKSLLFAGIMGIMFAMTGCSDENTNDTGRDSVPSRQIAVKVISSSEILTRTGIGGDWNVTGSYSTFWRIGDKLGLYTVCQCIDEVCTHPQSLNSEFTINEGGINADGVGCFDGSLSVPENENSIYTVYAYHPYRSVNSTNGSVHNNIRGDIPVLQTTRADGCYDEIAAFMIAEPQDVYIEAGQSEISFDNMKFEHMVSFVNVRIADGTTCPENLMKEICSEPVEYVMIEGPEGVVLGGDFTMCLETSRITFDSGTTSNTIMAKLPEGTVQNINELDLWLIVNPFKVSSSQTLTVTVGTTHFRISKSITGLDMDFRKSGVKLLAMDFNKNTNVEYDPEILLFTDFNFLTAGSGTTADDKDYDFSDWGTNLSKYFSVYDCYASAGGAIRLGKAVGSKAGTLRTRALPLAGGQVTVKLKVKGVDTNGTFGMGVVNFSGIPLDNHLTILPFTACNSLDPNGWDDIVLDIHEITTEQSDQGYKYIEIVSYKGTDILIDDLEISRKQ